MKKRIMALLMAMVLILGTSTTVLAAESSGADNTQTIHELEVAWAQDGSWTIEIQNLIASEDSYYDGMWYNVGLYNADDEYIGSTGAYGWRGEEVVKFDMNDLVAEEGAYYAVASTAYAEDGKLIMYQGTSEEKTYTNPGKRIAAPTVTISDSGVITFTMVEGAEKYNLRVDESFWGQVSGSAYTYLTYEWFFSSQCSYDLTFYPEDSADGKTITYDFGAEWKEYYENYTGDKPELDYTAVVRALSADITVAQHSVEVKSATIYSPNRKTAAEVVVKLDEALASGEAREVIKALATTNNDTLVELLKTDAAFVQKIADFDAKYAADYNITVTPKSEVAGIDNSKVSIIGAALNASKDDNVVLSIKTPAKAVTVPTQYANGVQLDIELLINDVAKSDLAIPVIITMPVPAGVSTENLVILHYHGDATEPEVITPVVNADGTMTFIVDGFSTFVVANQVAVTPATAPTAPKTGDAMGTTLVCSMLLVAAGAVVLMKRKSIVK